MLAQRYLDRQLVAQTVPLPEQWADLRRYAAIRRVAVLSPELLLTPYRLRAVFPVAGQLATDSVTAIARALAHENPEPLFYGLRGDTYEKTDGYALETKTDIPLGRTMQAIVRQIEASGGRPVFLIRSAELAAVFDLVTEPLPKTVTTLAQLVAAGVTVVVASDTAYPGLGVVLEPEAVTVQQDGNGILLSYGPSLWLQSLTELPVSLSQARRLVRRGTLFPF
jgi:hypothetical protein